MPGLKLKLRPDEQLLINGAVIQNGAYPVELTVKTPNTRILRLRDALHPKDVNTPVKRSCYIAQLAVAGAVTDEAACADFCTSAEELLKVFLDAASQDLISQAIEYAKEYNFYRAMQNMRKLIRYEEALMARSMFNADAPASSHRPSDHDEQGKHL